jgi:NAD(P)-dependent dehydrogenase (short-subunit alcohol dehydrogenase family)
MSLTNKRIIVTGAASGIGAATAKLLKSKGAYIIAFDLNKATENVDEYIPVDLSDKSSILEAVSKFKGTADVLCNIAGVPPTLPSEVQLKVNFFGLRTFTEAMVPQLNDGAAIINLASMAGMGWRDNIDLVKKCLLLSSAEEGVQFLKDNDFSPDTTYRFSKELVILYTLQQAKTWADRNITIKAVSPGPIQTPILQDFMDTIAKQKKILPPGSTGKPEDIAALVAFLCEPAASWINGQNIIIDGGLSAMRMKMGFEI